MYEALTATQPSREGLAVATDSGIRVRDRGAALNCSIVDAAVVLAEGGTFATLAEWTEDGFASLPSRAPMPSAHTAAVRVASSRAGQCVPRYVGTLGPTRVLR